MPIYRFIQHCKPTTNRTFHLWQTADVVIFVSAPDWKVAEERRTQILEEHRWEVLTTRSRSTLIESRVVEQGGKVLEAYNTASCRGYWVEIFSDHFGAGKRNKTIRAPRIDESFLDQIMAKAGGRRLTLEERGYDKIRNVDYLLQNSLVELKDIQEEGLEKPERQTKLADLFRPYSPDNDEILIDPSILTDDDIFRYADIVGEPLKNQIKSAAQQIKSTKVHLADDNLRGGIILLNSGYFTLTGEGFHELACRYAYKDTSQIEFVITITASSPTDGFSSWFNIQLFPSLPETAIEHLIADAFSEQVSLLMKKMVLQSFQPEESPLPIPVPITFVRNNCRFTYYPNGLPPPWTPNSLKS